MTAAELEDDAQKRFAKMQPGRRWGDEPELREAYRWRAWREAQAQARWSAMHPSVSWWKANMAERRRYRHMVEEDRYDSRGNPVEPCLDCGRRHASKKCIWL